MGNKIGVPIAQGLDVPKFFKDVPNFVNDVPNFVKDILNFVNDIKGAKVRFEVRNDLQSLLNGLQRNKWTM